MAIEPERGCGFRKVGGLYLCGSGHGMACDRLPYELKVCPVCGNGVKFSRGFQWLNWKRYAGNHHLEETEHLISAKVICHCNVVCPVCYPEVNQPYGLLWVGESFYTPQNFIQEAMQMGISRRIPAVPRNLKLGETWVLFAHISACGTRISVDPPFGTENIAGVFYAFRPQRVELLIWKSEAVLEYLEELKKKHITPIIIPDDDPDHDPRTSLKPKEEERSKVVLDNLRQKFMGV
jgi:hypothetical protein